MPYLPIFTLLFNPHPALTSPSTGPDKGIFKVQSSETFHYVGNLIFDSFLYMVFMGILPLEILIFCWQRKSSKFSQQFCDQF